MIINDEKEEKDTFVKKVKSVKLNTERHLEFLDLRSANTAVTINKL